MIMRKALSGLATASIVTVFVLAAMLEANPARAQEPPAAPVLAFSVPIEVSETKIRTFDKPLVLTVSGRRVDASEVLELRIIVESADMAALPPALQPRLFIGRTSYEIHRVEYSNWNLQTEKPVEPRETIAEFQFLYVFVPNAEQVERGSPMILTVLSIDELMKLTGGTFDVEILRRVLPGSQGVVPLFDPG